MRKTVQINEIPNPNYDEDHLRYQTNRSNSDGFWRSSQVRSFNCNMALALFLASTQKEGALIQDCRDIFILHDGVSCWNTPQNLWPRCRILSPSKALAGLLMDSLVWNVICMAFLA